MTKIYCLLDNNKKVRYIGKTKRLLRQRLWQHIYYAKRGDDGRVASHLYRWIRLMLRDGVTPTIELVNEFDGTGSWEEVGYIAYYRRIGADLTNTTDGGEHVSSRGMLGKHHSDKTKALLRERGLGRVVSAETRLKMSKSLKGKLIGRVYSKETIARMTIANSNRPASSYIKMWETRRRNDEIRQLSADCA